MEQVLFDTEDGVRLEGEMRMPDGEALGSAVLCHPHPEFGGSKDHPVLWAARIELARRGFAVLAFNFRGVMGSRGLFDGGVREVLDARAAVGLARERAPGPCFVFGWSFGANVALRAAVDDARVGALALMGIPLDGLAAKLPPVPPDERLAGFGRPLLVAVGEQDRSSPVEAVRDLAAKVPGAVLEVFPGADHYFHRRERELAERVAGFAAAALLA